LQQFVQGGVVLVTDRDKLAFADVIRPPIANRSENPWQGVTMVMDKGLGPAALADLLCTAASYIDFLKFGFGSTCLYREALLCEKVSLCRAHSVRAYAGGTLAEIAVQQDCFEAYLDQCLRYGIETVEVSEGTFPLSPLQRRRLIRTAARTHTVISEVGRKFEQIAPAVQIAAQIEDDLAAGASLVIVEGRESGQGAGIYGANGEIDECWIHQLQALLDPAALARIVWEAPQKAQQVWLLRRFGAQVNLGNIAPQEALALASLRRGLRADTLISTAVPLAMVTQ
jgi:phosphosulfolactate synthase